ncbi:OmpP1/FadL family transporter [Patiriisocius hiemis]|uniref:Outer membrane protein transport protein n=1 Tax=Patiriisocius hiemis TaxID=3075604 RepID=A0ABU2YFL9_9FLAO|nr:outer membrane protein transport protein [Constantimarinum sp. W242]MDT0556984.1 outer membrane protein transport protein [Constantimarinum sp. W242]
MKKKLIFFIVASIAMTYSQAQNIFDGLRYSQEQINGSARFQAMSGAFGALGGDLSAININPASSAIFLNNSAAISLGVLDKENEATYFNTSTSSFDTDISVNQGGLVFVFPNANEESPWRKISLGLNYNNTRNFDDELFVQGTSSNSISDFFLAQAQGIPLDLLELRPGETIDDLYSFLGESEGISAQNAFLGFQGFIFDPVDDNPNNTSYSSNVTGGNFNQDYALLSNGYNGKFSFNVATQYEDNLYFGINLNSHYFEYNESTFFEERNSNAGSTINQIGFQNNLATTGAGFSAQIGAIYKVTNELRIGATYDTPTWYEISEETSQYLETERTENGQQITQIVDPRVINIFENYNLTTPGKISASAAYVFGKKGLLSFDYSYKDYSNIKFRPSNDILFSTLNTSIENNLKAVSSYRLGGEYKIQNFSLRGGYHFEESPYQDEITVGDITGFSLGLGYNFGNYTFDLAYSRSEQSRNQQFYDVGFTNSSSINTINSAFVFTLGFSI